MAPDGDAPPTPGSVEELKASILRNLVYAVGKDQAAAQPRDWFHALARSVRDHGIASWMETTRAIYSQDTKRVYYLSLEFLLGRLLGTSLIKLGLTAAYRRALAELGQSLDELIEIEPDAALGNGGLGRLAACYLGSMASLGLPGYGYGIRYNFGLFEQRFEDGWQVEEPEQWLRYGNPWEFPRAEVLYPIRFYGRVEAVRGDDRRRSYRWVGGDQVYAMAYDTPLLGAAGGVTNTLRLWSAQATRSVDLSLFHSGDYLRAVEHKVLSETLNQVLYPNDSTPAGRELRLKQEYFFTSASLQDILRRFVQHHTDLTRLPDRVAIQLNDTHPAIGIAEMMRLLVDGHGVRWEAAWELTRHCFAYTNHTLLPEALETWPVGLIERLLPRHMQIIYDINAQVLQGSAAHRTGDIGRVARLSLIDEHGERAVRMANLAFIGSHKVNGVSRLHTELMKSTVFADLHAEFPDRILNQTNGITPRRWLIESNPALSDLITASIGTGWMRDLSELTRLEPKIADPGFRDAYAAAKLANKRRLADFIRREAEIEVESAALFDVQIKRIHEYKRQLLNLLQAVALYNDMRANPHRGWTPVVKVFAGKAAPGYEMAKLIIKLINDVARVVNTDPAVRDLLKIVFLPNYSVSAAQVIMPAADLSEQISTAGMEASGTGNMKLALNGAITLGTLDGANVEIREAVGPDNVIIFGLTADEAHRLRAAGCDARAIIAADPALRQALDMIGSGTFSPDDVDRFKPVVASLADHGDRFLVTADFAAYRAAFDRAVALYRDRDAWITRTATNTARMGWFSSDRAVAGYAREIWGVTPLGPHSAAPIA